MGEVGYPIHCEVLGRLRDIIRLNIIY